jgi:hypothetical protein
MAGIEEAFEKFVTRVSSRERSPAEQPLSKYKSYSEQELLENIEAKYPNQLQSFSQEDYQLNTMPMFEPKDVAPPRSYSPMPVEKYLRGREYMDLAEGGVASMFRERPGYQVGGFITMKDNGDFVVTYPSGSSSLYSGTANAEFLQNLMSQGYHVSGQQNFPTIDPFTGKPYDIDPNAPVQPVGPAPPDNYYDEIPTIDPFSGQQVSAQDQMAFAQPQATEVSTIDPFSTSSNNTGFELKKSEDGSYQIIPSGKSIITSEGSYTLPSFYPGEYVLKDFGDRYQLVSAKDLNPPTPAAGYTEEGIRKIAEDTASREQAMANAFNNISTIDPFSGQQVSMQDQMAFAQPQQDIFPQQNIFQPPSPVDQFIGERRFQAEADAAARSGIPFTKTKDDYFSDLGLTAYGKTAFDAFNQIGLTPEKQAAVNKALGSASGIGRALLGEIGGGFKSTGAVGFGEYVGQGLRSLGQAATLNNVNLGVNPAVGGGTLGSRVLGSLIGAPAIYATALFNPTTMGNAELTPAMRSQQEAAARVTPTRMAYGGRVSMSDGGLTNTIPPAKGPDSQGVESLFRRRYN